MTGFVDDDGDGIDDRYEGEGKAESKAKWSTLTADMPLSKVAASIIKPHSQAGPDCVKWKGESEGGPGERPLVSGRG